MSERDVEVLERLYAAFNRRDMPGILECFDPDIEVFPTEDLEYAARLLRVLGPRFVVLSGGYRGHDEVRRLFETVWAISDWFSVEPEEYVQHAGAVVVPLIMRARSADSGAEGEARTVHAFTMANGRALTWRVYADRERALAAAEKGFPGGTAEE
jgi:ketosteroid isomerase-like protein